MLWQSRPPPGWLAFSKERLTKLLGYGDPQGACSWHRYLIRNSFFPVIITKCRAAVATYFRMGKHTKGTAERSCAFLLYFQPDRSIFKGSSLARPPHPLGLNRLNGILYTYCTLGPASLRETHSPGPAPSPSVLLFPILWKQGANKNDTPSLWASATCKHFWNRIPRQAETIWLFWRGWKAFTSREWLLIPLSVYLHSEESEEVGLAGQKWEESSSATVAVTTGILHRWVLARSLNCQSLWRQSDNDWPFSSTSTLIHLPKARCVSGDQEIST